MRHGPAVLDSVLRYISASSMQMFDENVLAGCERKWWFRYKARIKDDEDASQFKLGQQCHAQTEHYEKTGEDVLGPIVRAGLRFIPKPGPDLMIEHSFGRPLELMPGGAHGRMISPVTAGDVPLIGSADLMHTRGVWIDPEGEEQKEEGRVAEVVDWKTTSRISDDVCETSGLVKSRGFAKSGQEIAQTWQMLAYAQLAVDLWPDLEGIRLSHVYFQTKGRRDAAKVSHLLTREESKARWDRSADLVSRMKAVALLEKPSDVRANYSSCDAYRGCAYKAQCPRDPKMVLKFLGGARMGLLDKYKAKTAEMKAEAIETKAEKTIETVKPTASEVQIEIEKLKAEEKAAVLPPDAPVPEKIAEPEPGPTRVPGTPCAAGGKQIELTSDQAADRKITCATCGEPVKVKPQKMPDSTWRALLPHHGGDEEKKIKKTKADSTAEAPKSIGEQVMPAARFEILLDCHERKAFGVKRLEDVAEKIAADLCREYGAIDIRCAPGDSPLGFGKWKGALSGIARDLDLTGTYEVSSLSELGMVVFEALASKARVVSK